MLLAIRLSGIGCKLYMQLLFAWHDMEYPDSFRMTDTKLMAATNIKSRSALRKAKKELEQAGLISYTPSNTFGGTTYRIMDVKE